MVAPVMEQATLHRVVLPQIGQVRTKKERSSVAVPHVIKIENPPIGGFFLLQITLTVVGKQSYTNATRPLAGHMA